MRVWWAGADGCCRKISGLQAAASSPKDIATPQPHVLLAHRPSSLQYAQGIPPHPDPSVTPSSRPHAALRDPLKNHRGRLEYRRIDDGEEVYFWREVDDFLRRVPAWAVIVQAS